MSTTKKDNWKEEYDYLEDNDWQKMVGDELIIVNKKDFIQNLLSQQNSYLRSEVEKMKPENEEMFSRTWKAGYYTLKEDILKMMSDIHE